MRCYAESEIAPPTRMNLPITVVIPAFNAGKTIGRTIASVHAQTTGPAEIIVVDDGSSDGTAEIARASGASVIVQRNAGSGVARNAGIRAATQPWIALLDADDEWLPGKLEAQWRVASLHPGVGLIATDFSYVHENGVREEATMKKLSSYARASRTRVGSDVSFLRREDAARAMIGGFFLLPSTLLISAAVFEGGGNFFRGRCELEATPLCAEPEDFEWCLRALRSSDVLVVERSLVAYHWQPESFSSSAGRMRYGDVALGERVLANPADYPAGLASEILRVRLSKLRESSREFLRAGNIGQALTVAERALAESGSLRDRLVVAGLRTGDSRAGHVILELARALWKLALKPALRWAGLLRT